MLQIVFATRKKRKENPHMVKYRGDKDYFLSSAMRLRMLSARSFDGG